MSSNNKETDQNERQQLPHSLLSESTTPTTAVRTANDELSAATEAPLSQSRTSNQEEVRNRNTCPDIPLVNHNVNNVNFNNNHNDNMTLDTPSDPDSAPTSSRRLEKTDSSSSSGGILAVANLEEIPMVHAVSFIHDNVHHPTIPQPQHFHHQQQHIVSSSSMISSITPSTDHMDHPSSQHSFVQILSDDGDDPGYPARGHAPQHYSVVAGTVLSNDDTATTAMATATTATISTTTTTLTSSMQVFSATSMTATASTTTLESNNLAAPPPPWMFMNGSTVLPLSHISNVSHVELDSPDPEHQPVVADSPSPIFCCGVKRRFVLITLVLLVIAGLTFITGFAVATNLFHSRDRKSNNNINNSGNYFIAGNTTEDESEGNSSTTTPTVSLTPNSKSPRQPIVAPSLPTSLYPTLAPSPSPKPPTHHHPSLALGCNITSARVFHNSFGSGILGNVTTEDCICYCQGTVEAFFQGFCYCGRRRKPSQTLTPVTLPTHAPNTSPSVPSFFSSGSSSSSTVAPTTSDASQSPTDTVLSIYPSASPTTVSNQPSSALITSPPTTLEATQAPRLSTPPLPTPEPSA